MKRLKLFLFNTIILTLTSLFMSLINIFFSVYVAKVLGSEGARNFRTTYVHFYIWNNVCKFWDKPCRHKNYFWRNRWQWSESGIKTAMRKCIIYSLCFGSIACIFFIAFAPYCSSVLLHGKVTNIPIYIMAISLPFTSLVTSLSRLFYRCKTSF